MRAEAVTNRGGRGGCEQGSSSMLWDAPSQRRQHLTCVVSYWEVACYHSQSALTSYYARFWYVFLSHSWPYNFFSHVWGIQRVPTQSY